MRLSKVLLLLSAYVTFTYANGLEVSSLEDGVNGSNFDVGFGESSEPDFDDHNVAPVEAPVSNPPAGISEPVTDAIPSPADISSLPPKTPPVDVNTIPAGLPPKNPPKELPPSISTPITEAPSNQESGDNIPSPDSASVNSGNVEADAGENSHDEAEGVAAGDSAANGEASDDYGDANPIDQLDGVAPADTLDNANVESDAEGAEAADGINAADANAGENSEEDGAAGESVDSTNTGAVAAGLCGAAALSSAGIFLWVKKSKRQGYVQSVRTQISMV